MKKPNIIIISSFIPIIGMVITVYHGNYMFRNDIFKKYTFWNAFIHGSTIPLLLLLLF